uniref:Uncharacterized protein n=1 Tax=Panagrolaimus sp. JU765 TaxID=591449 RepID=A0AC34QXE5_9BILA
MNPDLAKEIPKNPDQLGILPDSIGIGLESSAVALTAFLADRWARGINHPGWQSHPQGGIHAHNTVDEFLTESFIYWISGPVHALRFLHFTQSNTETSLFDRATLKLPVGILATSRVPYPVSRYFLEQRFWNIVHFSEAEKGGEFVAIEIPEMLAKEIFAFVETVHFK